ncbi:hypothetical protein ACJIZ3_017554 [Penstemon smallii]|uniref:Uncharacterized protein n=1 Tax=Penstemon smallii TaxID=265156 RepID=A0ABD3SVV7_9LAMI
MRKEMGNQNTSGIVAEDKVANEAPIDAREENQMLTQEEETKDSHEKSAEIDDFPGASVSEKLPTSEKEEVNGIVNEENSERGLSNSDNDVHNQESSLNGETPKIDLNSERNLNSLPHEAVGNTSATREETLESSKIGSIQEDSELVETKVEQNLRVSLILGIDNQDDVKRNEDDLVVTDMTSDEAAFLETSKQNVNSVVETTGDNIENGVGKERNVDPVNDEIEPSNQSISISALDSTEARNEPLNESLVLDVVPELGNQIHPPDQAIESDIKKNNEQLVVEIDPLSRSDSIKSIPIEEELQDSNKEANELVNETGLVQTETNQEEVESQETRNDHAISSITSEAEIQPSLIIEKYSCNEAYIPQVIEYEGNENGERPSVDVGLKKSPSFEFGLPFDAMLEDSDKTPLLYQDRTAIRRYSSCSNLRFINTSNAQNEYYSGKSLLQCEEKTIRMERSNSDNLMKKEENTINVVTINAKEENSSSGNKKQSKGNGKKKARSSLFTTCICCSAEVIS